MKKINKTLTVVLSIFCYLFSIFAVLVLFINQEMIYAAKTPVKLNDILTI